MFICKLCNNKFEKVINGFCHNCYYKEYYKIKKNYYSYYYKKDKNIKNPLLSNNKQVDFLTSKEKVCSVCGKTFFSKGRINAGKTCSVECRKKHYTLYHSQPRIKAQRKAYQQSHLKERQIYLKKKELENPVHKLAHLLRSNLKRNLVLNFNDKDNTRFEELVGYSYVDLKLHLEKQFTSDMSWDNYGTYWQVDHVVPLSWFKTKSQFLKRGWALSNLQPLESSLNLSKQNKFVGSSKSCLSVVCL
jgi:hypothetical protein